MSYYTPPSPLITRPVAGGLIKPQTGWVFATAVLLVSVPVFIEAPLVRQLPELSLIITIGWLGLSQWLIKYQSTKIWGDLIFGFSWSWLAGSIYWGWLRWEPLLHLPVEAIALPVIIGCLRQQKWQIGSWFYLGSLFGTAITDIYFYLVDLIPYWRKIMEVEPELTIPIFQSAIAQVKTPWGIGWAIILSIILLVVGLLPLRSHQKELTPHLPGWAFSGAVLSTILVDSLFGLAASVV